MCGPPRRRWLAGRCPPNRASDNSTTIYEGTTYDEESRYGSLCGETRSQHIPVPLELLRPFFLTQLIPILLTLRILPRPLRYSGDIISSRVDGSDGSLSALAEGVIQRRRRSKRRRERGLRPLWRVLNTAERRHRRDGRTKRSRRVQARRGGPLRRSKVEGAEMGTSGDGVRGLGWVCAILCDTALRCQYQDEGKECGEVCGADVQIWEGGRRVQPLEAVLGCRGGAVQALLTMFFLRSHVACQPSITNE